MKRIQVAVLFAALALLSAHACGASRILAGSKGSGNSPAAAASSDDCHPLVGFTTGFEANEWSPFVLKTQDEGQGSFKYPSSSPNAASGQFGAALTVTKPGSALWHVQLSSAPTKLSAGKFYTLHYSVRSSGASYMQVALVSDSTWKEFFAEQPKTTPAFVTRTTVDLTPPESGTYLLNFDVGLAAANTTFAFDDIMICEQDQQTNKQQNNNPKVQEVTGVLRPDTSTGFEQGSPMMFKTQVTAPADASVVMQLRHSAAAASGSFGAAVTVNKPGAEPWHVQLTGPAIPLDASKSYTVQLSLRRFGSSNSNKDNVLQVNWVQPKVWIPTSLSSIQPTANFVSYTLPPISPPSSGLYYLTVDMGTVAAGTTLYFDDIRVYEAYA